MATIEWENGKVKIIDQNKLPHELVRIYCPDVKTLREAISSLKVRGAPALGIAGAFGAVLGIQNSSTTDFPTFARKLEEVIDYLGSSRPTAVNLFWALRRMRDCAEKNKDREIPQVKRALEEEALQIMEEDRIRSRQMAKKGASLLKDGDRVLTHCNAGALATADYGTALGVIYRAKEEGKKVTVYADETRPLLQGARLTTWELLQGGVEVTLICDNMAGDLMQRGKIDKVLVGADRVAANGDVANKIGTYTLAVLAKENEIPFYVVCPISSIDLQILSGNMIPIEERDSREVTHFARKRVAPNGVKVYNPAFDITPAHYITAIITERQIFRPPYKEILGELKR
ncbi:S-methyl-5-thioribose-1-phosphate isomerase [Candidatus Aerophobetes bacterium]|uniref:Methylthioribose-1-phosphate isomerase n=1 Tax=Aerophobetes bacterium TaxID=2030807 RepID=A0A523W2B9_UNCAE|nr:MAG: S-methyl-5-thioribose-1-phosphate isomerase [Candidatus Aerophobetes bacterium]